MRGAYVRDTRQYYATDAGRETPPLPARSAVVREPGRRRALRHVYVYAYARAVVTSEPPSNGAAARDVFSPCDVNHHIGRSPRGDARRGCRPGRLAFGLSHALRTLCRSVPLVVNELFFFLYSHIHT